MKKLAVALLGVLLFASWSGPVMAAAKAPTPQQSKMKSCAADYHAKGIAKSQYHAFMSQCLKKGGKASTAAAKNKTKPSGK